MKNTFRQPFISLVWILWTVTILMSLSILYPPEPLPDDYRGLLYAIAVGYPLLSFLCIRRLIRYKYNKSDSPAYMRYDISGFH